MSRAFLEISCRGCITLANGPALPWPQLAALGFSRLGGWYGCGEEVDQDLEVALISAAVLQDVPNLQHCPRSTGKDGSWIFPPCGMHMF